MAPLLRIAKKHGIKFVLLFALIGAFVYLYGVNPKYQGYAADQPIPFSHKIHAGELGVDCQFCHTSVDKSAMASVPDTATCMKCHAYVASDSPDIQYLRKTYEKGIPMRWNKVHDLPDHAKFSHKVHIARGYDCAQCHGNVAEMDKVEVTSEFNMGWCVNCHRDQAKQMNLDKEPGGNHSLGITDCSTCHY
ncbi:MAG: cytochrome c3 family protein [Leptospiraceae bacterium]